MTDRSNQERKPVHVGLWLLIATVSLVVLGGQVGCQATPKPAHPDVKASAAIEASTASIGRGDLDAAKAELAEAKGHASGFHQRRQVRSLADLIAGAEALMAGEVERARAAWSRIEDPRLQREVRIKAKAMGIHVPLQSTPVGAASGDTSSGALNKESS